MAAPTGKASGASQISAEVLLVAPRSVAAPLALLFRAVVTLGCAPSTWRRAIIHPLFKKGDPTTIENYRPISLTEVPRKIFERVLLEPLTRAISPWLHVEQGGFRTKRGTLDQVAVLQQWVLESVAHRRPRVMAFLDIKAAYDQVDRRLLWRRLVSKGVDPILVRLVQSLFDYNSSQVAIRGRTTPAFQNESGLLQGSLLSPILYDAFIDGLVEHLAVGRAGARVDRHIFKGLLYADDLVVFGNSVEEVQRSLTRCVEHAIANRYQFNVGKCAVVSSMDEPVVLQMYGVQVPVVDQFLYLGVPFCHSGIRWKDHWTRLGGKAMNAASALHSCGINGGACDIVTALGLYKGFVRPILEYGLPLCRQVDAICLERYQKAAVKKMASLTRSVSVDALGLFGGLVPMSLRRVDLQERWLRRVRRAPPSFAVHYAVQAQEYQQYVASCVSSLDNELLHRRRQVEERLMQRRMGRQVDGDLVHVTMEMLIEEWVERTTRRLSSAWIWKELDEEERRRLAGWVRKLPLATGRALVLWVSNMAVGRWKRCRRCGEPASKRHLEGHLPQLGQLPSVIGSPSAIEEVIRSATSYANVKRAAELALRLLR
jgi:hypothetical protein